ncbi:MAG TPA: PD-(D/E)XK motif protein [Ignavibacteria bacterium]|jgi:hypothetical protein|nr:PD-(D/E)XK motif protein [Ignavibacteria bacterium]
MMKINEIWNELENDTSVSSGLLLRRYAAKVLPDVYIALRQPEGLRCVALHLNSESQVNIEPYNNLRDISIQFFPDEKDGNRYFLLILLASPQYEDVFSTLCEDLILEISNVTGEEKIVKELLNRFEKWRSLFDKAGLQGLTPEEQRGLFGELYFLRKWLSHSSNLHHCIDAWLGPEKGLRDFQLADWAVEVKTTHGNNHQKIHISSERQLDTSNLNTLFLYHLSLETHQQHGEKLNHLVDSILELLNNDAPTQTQFKSKLMQGGYFFHHKPLYDNTGYFIRDESFYTVVDNFPRIEEADIHDGVGDVKYSIVLSNYSEYKISESSVIEIIK